MTRTPNQLAALASAAIPGLKPVATGALLDDPGAGIDSAIVQDDAGRSWLARAGSSPTSAVALDAGAAAAAVLARRIGVTVPVSQGTVSLPDGGRVHVQRVIAGRELQLAGLEPEHPLAPRLGELLARIHNLDPDLLEDAGLESYTPDEYRQRRLTELDRAAATGRVPAALLTRWEEALENVALWQWVPVPVHGGLEGRHVLLTEDAEGAATIHGVVGWRRAKVADPADDFAGLIREAAPAAVIAVAKAYARARTTRPDRHLLTRAQLFAELGYVTDLIDAIAAGYPQVVAQATDRLHELADEVSEIPLIPSGRAAGSTTGPTTGSARSSADSSPQQQTSGAEPGPAITEPVRLGGQPGEPDSSVARASSSASDTTSG